MIGIKDIFRLIGISIVCFCAVFVCTFFLNFYIDVSSIESVPEHLTVLYEAQLTMAQFTSAISGGFMGAIAAVMLAFYIRLFITAQAIRLGTLKAMGYTEWEISRKFWVFGFSVFLGSALGYASGHAVMPYFYDRLLINGMPEVEIGYHVSLLFLLVVLPTAVYSFASCFFAYMFLKKPVCALLRGETEKIKITLEKTEKERPFLKEMFFKCAKTKKLLVFFVAFGAFCFSAMVQMGFSMTKVSAESMAELILAIGLTLAVVALTMSAASLLNANAQNVSVMKSFGYGVGECLFAVFGGSIPFAFLGFAVGTVYQYGLLRLMIDLIFKDVEGVGEYSFDVGLMFITLAAFVLFYACVLSVYMLRMVKIKHMANE